MKKVVKVLWKLAKWFFMFRCIEWTVAGASDVLITKRKHKLAEAKGIKTEPLELVPIEKVIVDNFKELVKLEEELN